MAMKLKVLYNMSYIPFTRALIVLGKRFILIPDKAVSLAFCYFVFELKIQEPSASCLLAVWVNEPFPYIAPQRLRLLEECSDDVGVA